MNDEDDDFDALYTLIATERDKYPRLANDMDSGVLAHLILSAGFRRVGPVTAETVEAALHAYHGTTPLPGWVWRAGEPEAMRAALQAALEVGHE